MEIMLNGHRVKVVLALQRGAYSYPHAYVLPDGAFVSRRDGADRRTDGSEEPWVLISKPGQEPKTVTVRRCGPRD